MASTAKPVFLDTKLQAPDEKVKAKTQISKEWCSVQHPVNVFEEQGCLEKSSQNFAPARKRLRKPKQREVLAALPQHHYHQPMDQGIIANLKHHYHSIVVKQLIVAVDRSEPPVVSMLDAMLIIQLLRHLVKQSTIVNCFSHFHFKAPETQQPELPTKDQEENIPLADSNQSPMLRSL